MRTKFLAVLAALMLCTMALAPVAMAADYTLKVVFLGNTNDEDYDGSLVFKDYVESHSNGKIAVEIYPGGQLCGNARECIEATQAGVIEVHMATVGGFANTFPPIQVLDLPYLVDGDRMIEKVFSGPFVDQLRQEVLKETGNIRIMTISNTGGWRNIANTKRPVHSPADVKGLKLRTITSELQMELVKLLGGSPTPVPWPETYTSLATGVVEGSKNGITDIVGMKFHEHIKYITLDGHAYMTALWFMNNDIFMSLPMDLRKIVQDGFAQLQMVTTAMPKRRQIEAYEEFKKSGGQIYVPTPEEKAQFAAAAAPLKKWYTDKYGDKLLNMYEAAIEQAKKEIEAEDAAALN